MGGVRKQDRRHLWIAFFSLGSIMAAHAIGETARDALFLSGLEATALPYAYLTIAGLALFVVRANSRILHWVADKRRLLACTMLVAAAADTGFWFWLEGDPPQGRAFVLYVWTGLFATVTVVQFWLLLDDVVDVAQAKRIFGPVAAGGVLGATFGALAAERILDNDFAARHLMLAAAICLAVGSAFPLLWRKREVHPQEEEQALPTSVEHGILTLCRHVYLRRLLALVLVSTIALTGADYVFKSVVADAFTTTQELGSFFARFYLGLNGLALVVQLFLSGWLLRLVGVNRTLVVLPFLLLVSTVGFLVVPGLIAVILMKGADGSLRHSLHRTATEVLYLPLPRELRERFKGMIDGVGQRGGQALASLGILAMVYFDAGVWIVAATVAAFTAAWLFVLAGLKAPYLALFKQSLRGGSMGFDDGLVALDLHSLEALLTTLNSDRDDEVLVALELFERYGRTGLLPKLILYHPSTPVALRALEIFINEGDPAFLPIARRLLRSGNPELRSGALRAITALEPDEELLARCLDDESPDLAATALVGMLAEGFGDREELERRLARTRMEGALETRRELARAIARRPDPFFVDTLLDLLADRDLGLRLAVLDAMAAIPDPRTIPRLLPLLGEGTLRPATREVLRRIGAPALEALAAAFDDEELPRRVRRHLPRTIHRFGSTEALQLLQHQFERERDGAVRYKILRGLGRLMSNDPTLPLDRDLIREKIRAHLERTVHLLHMRESLERGVKEDPRRNTEGAELLIVSLREKETNALERLFRLNHLLNPQESFQLYWRGLTSSRPSVRAASRELLEHALQGVVREVVLALIDDAPAMERCAAAASALDLELPEFTYEECLAHMVVDPSDTMRAIAAHHIAELGLTDLTPKLEQNPAKPGSAVAEVFDRAIEVLRSLGPRNTGAPSVA